MMLVQGYIISFPRLPKSIVSTLQVLKLAEKDAIPPWSITADYVETCNCDYGCPCNFNGFPTFGFCRALVLYHLKEGSRYGKTDLSGLDVVYVGNWPKAIHEGDGTVQIYASRNASPEQRKGVVNIFHGWAKGDGPFALFATTVKYNLEPQFVDVRFKIDGRRSSFSVSGVLDAELEPFKNPKTGEESDTRVTIPKGFIWKEALAAKTRKMRIVSPNFTFDDSGQNAFFAANLKFKGP